MSALPVDPPAEEPVRRWTPPSREDWIALRDRARRNLAVVRAYGLLDCRGGDDPDPTDGSDLLSRIEDQDTSGLNDAGWLDRLEALTRVEARVAALKAAAIAGFDDATRGVSADLGHEVAEPGDRPAGPGERRWHAGLLRSVSDEVGLVLGLHRAAADARIVRSWELTHGYPRILAALSDGTLTERAAFTLVDELSAISDESQVRAAETALLQWARKHPLQRIKQAARREVARHDAAAMDKVRRRALSDRAIRMIGDTCGTADLISTHDAVHAAAAMTCLTQAAVRLRRAGDPRTLDQLRADIALHRMLGNPDPAVPSQADHGDLGAAQVNAGACPGGSRVGSVEQSWPSSGVEVVIHASAAEVAAILQQTPGSGGELDGHGPVPQSVLTDALTAALVSANGNGGLRSTVSWQVSDRVPPSNPLRYTPSAALDRWVRHRDRRCRFPGCNQPAVRCDLDHRRPFNPEDPDGGRTTADNLHALCRHHHRLKHRGGWKHHRNPDGSTTWISPTGRQYRDSHNTDP